MRRILATLSLCLTAVAAPGLAEVGTEAFPSAGQDMAAQRAALAAGLQRIRFIAGSWAVTRYSRDRDGAWTANETQIMTVEPSMNDLYLDATFAAPGFAYRMVFSYDAVMETYRVVSRDDQSGLIDVYQGNFTPEGVLVLTNLESGTHYKSGGLKIHNRMTFTPTAEGWTVSIDGSADEGATWRPQGRHEARRPVRTIAPEGAPHANQQPAA